MSGFCTACGYRLESFEGLNKCPACSSTSIPCDDSNQVLVSVNWHELRILVIWAENYARDKDLGDTVAVIARRLEDQHPDHAIKIPLTLAGELRQLADRYPGTYTTDPKLQKAMEEHHRINEVPPTDPAT